ncbi:MAG: putative lipid II flippase FtsW [Bacilli bacterium]
MKIDKQLIFYTILLSCFGILMIYSASFVWAEYKFGDPLKFAFAQSIFFIIGLIIMLVISKIPYVIYKEKSNLIFGISLILLIAVLIPGVGIVRNGSRSWFGIGSLGIQPSEFMKLALIIFTAKYLEKNYKQLENIKKGVFPILGINVLVFGLIMLQPDFGSGMIIFSSVIILLFIGGVDMNFFFKLGGIGIGFISILVAIAPYRLARILSFLNPWSDPLGSGFQIIQSLYAIGPGGLLGQGLFSSVQKNFYLPEPQTDFIFSIISEELGFMGVIIVLTIMGLIIYRGLFIAFKQKDLYAKYVAIGISLQIAVQALLNIMVVIGLLPVTGVTLPFLSYGGSSLVISLISIGIILNISRYSEK